MLLLTFPELKQEQGSVTAALDLMGVNDDVMKTWRSLVAQELITPETEDEFS